MKTTVTNTTQLLVFGLLSIFVGRSLLHADQLELYTVPNTQGDTFVVQMNGTLLTNFYSVSNSFAPPLDRGNITNLLQAYYVAQNPTNFDLYASLFESDSRPLNDGEFGATPNSMWLKALYQYGTYTMADIRFRYLLDGEQVYLDTLLTMIQTNGLYFLTADLEDPAVCLFDQEREQTEIWDGAQLLATNWTGIGCFAVTNFSFQTNLANPWVFWLPGTRITNIVVSTNLPVVTNMFSPENVVIAGVQALINNDTNAYLQLIHPAEINNQLEYYDVTPGTHVTSQWNASRNAVINGVSLSEKVAFGDTAYVTFELLDASGAPIKKDWLFLKGYNGEWRLSQNHTEDGNLVVSYLFDSCNQFSPLAPKVLPGE